MRAALRYIFLKILVPTAIFIAIVGMSVALLPWVTATSYSKGDLPKRPFYIAVADMSDPLSVKLVPLNQINASTCCILLPKVADVWAKDAYATHAYTVLESKGSEQLIETEVREEDYKFWFRYRVSDNNVTPIRSKISHVGDVFMGFMIAAALFVLRSLLLRLRKKR